MTDNAPALAAGIQAALIIRLIAEETSRTYTATEVAELVASVIDEQSSRLYPTADPDLGGVAYRAHVACTHCWCGEHHEEGR